jgi:hypothetical protein
LQLKTITFILPTNTGNHGVTVNSGIYFSSAPPISIKIQKNMLVSGTGFAAGTATAQLQNCPKCFFYIINYEV